MSTFFTSDHHWGHANIIRHCSRPFVDVEEMDDLMIASWNKTVGKDDTVYHLGDFAYKASDGGDEVLKLLNGKIILIAGNHDTAPHESKGRAMNFRLFHETHSYLELTIEDQFLVLFHYPIEGWNDKWKKSWHLHGHSHGKAKKMKGRLDVGVDTHDFRPWSWQEIKEHFNPKLTDAF